MSCPCRACVQQELAKARRRAREIEQVAYRPEMEETEES